MRFLIHGALCGLLAAPALGQSFSSGRANSVLGATDAAIPGFIGPGGTGLVNELNIINPIFVAWATGYQDYFPTDDVSAAWRDPSVLIGPVSGDNFDVVSLGDLTASQIAASLPCGRVTATFTSGISNGNGADFAVFENAFGTDTSLFAELAYVEVSSDGANFARFATTSTNTSPGTLGFVDPRRIYGLAGKHVNAFGQSWGTPFDLADLAGDPLVAGNLVDLSQIRFVRLIDVPGSGNWKDSQNSPIFDSWPTSDSGGFDLQAIGVIHTVSPLTGVPGDATLDGRVDTVDFNLLAGHFGVGIGATWGQGDFNADGVVDSSDFNLFVGNYGYVAPSLSLTGTVVPEPSLLGIALLGCFSGCRLFR